VSGEEAAQLGELCSDDEHLAASCSVSFQKFSISPFCQIVPFFVVHKLRTFLAGSPCAGATSRKHGHAIQYEIGARIDSEHGRRLTEIAMISADGHDARLEVHAAEDVYAKSVKKASDLL
jgi:hypothetical protein